MIVTVNDPITIEELKSEINRVEAWLSHRPKHSVDLQMRWRLDLLRNELERKENLGGYSERQGNGTEAH